jgi:hypothetical protein
MGQEQDSIAEAAEAQPRGRCVIRTETGLIVLDCCTREDCDRRAIEESGDVEDWEPDPDCD